MDLPTSLVPDLTAIKIQPMVISQESIMIERRRFQRIRFTALCELIHNRISYKGRLENISLNGALVSSNEGLIVPQDDECILTFSLTGEADPLRMVVTVIYSNFTMIGIKFVSMDAETRERLINLVTALSGEPERITDELRHL